MSTPRKVLVTGASGQLGQAIQLLAPDHLHIIGVSRGELDITDAQQVSDCVEAHRPDVVINAAAYTAVDKAESEPEQARLINTEGARHVAGAAQRRGGVRAIGADEAMPAQRSTRRCSFRSMILYTLESADSRSRFQRFHPPEPSTSKNLIASPQSLREKRQNLTSQSLDLTRSWVQVE